MPVFKSQGRSLTNLRFADDVLLAARSKADIIKMLKDFAQDSEKCGLKLNYGKTKVMTWNHYRHSCRDVRIGLGSVEVLGEDAAERYLGRKLALSQSHMVELDNRIGAAWAAFHKHKQKLCSKHYKLQDRCRLFDATITPTLLYGCVAWALTGQMEKALNVQRRRMLRYVFRLHHRHSQET